MSKSYTIGKNPALDNIKVSQEPIPPAPPIITLVSSFGNQGASLNLDECSSVILLYL